jgi:hypothetical protein
MVLLIRNLRSTYGQGGEVKQFCRLDPQQLREGFCLPIEKAPLPGNHPREVPF